MTIKQFKEALARIKADENGFAGAGFKMPAIFVGHGSPMNAIEDNEYSRGWTEIGQKLPKPKAILAISAHWLTSGTTEVHMALKPQTIHDFYGFPKALYDMRYDCPGSPEFAAKVRKMVQKVEVLEDTNWGIDHGTWIVLTRMFPEADIPTFQLSIDYGKPAEYHYALGGELAELRRQGVLIMGSGNIVHNLGVIKYERDAKPYDWALEFDDATSKLIEKGDYTQLFNYENLPGGAESVPTPDHYWPLFYTLGVRLPKDNVSFPVSGIAHGSAGMRAVLFE